MFRNFVAWSLLLAASSLGCSSPPTQAMADDAYCVDLPAEQRATDARGACPNDLPSDTACDGAPSYRADIAGIVGGRCASCHGPGGIEAALPLGSYAQLNAQRRTALNQIFTCQMPPACALDVTPDERAKLLAWFVCGALDN